MSPQIVHVAIWTDDIEWLRLFYMKHFGVVSSKKYVNVKKRFESYFLSFTDGPKLEIMTCHDWKLLNSSSPCSGYAHLALSVGSESDVDTVTSQLQSKGVPVVDGPRCTESVGLTPHGSIFALFSRYGVTKMLT